jgi:ATP-dependent helicase/nuclease subunit B
MKGLYAIPLGVPFLPALVQGLIAETEHDPLQLASYLVILPTRRGCLGFHQAFQEATPHGCRILPRMMALADIEEGADLPGYMPVSSFLPAIPSWQRLGLLSQLVLAFERQKGGNISTPAGAVRLAQELMRLVDEVETTGLSLQDLKGEAEYAAHWQLTLDFLKILTDFWPPILEQKGLMEPAARRRMILEQVAQTWRPPYPVILAGTTGTRPATALLAEAVLKMDQGRVILPGVDFQLADWESLLPTHPQYTLSQLIHRLGVPQVWPGQNTNQSRFAFLSKTMTESPDWRISASLAADITASVQAIEAPSLLEEAQQIALIMRFEMETPGQIVALVTPDGELTRRVRSALVRWGLFANLSSGLPLTQSVVGRFLLHSSLLTQERGAADVLALLKHPLCAKGRDRFAHISQVRQFEIDVLRKASSHPFPTQDICEPLLKLADGKTYPFADFLKAHGEVAEALVGDKALLWGDDDGQVALAFWKSLEDQASDFPPLTGRDYPAVVRHLMAQEVVREREGIGSRLLILGALEARLLQADVVILGGLNEGTWPAIPEEDPWLSKALRLEFGLPPGERKIGLSAHDFCTAMTASKVYMTRSLKRDGAPTLPSRWWQRMAALLSTGGGTLSALQPWGEWSQQLDQPVESVSFEPPAPCPPLSARPRRLSVTAVEKLIRDPYSFYAKAILGLRPLDPLEADLSTMERGQAIHQVLDAFVRSGTDPRSPGALMIFEELGRQAFADLLRDPRAMAFWWPRFQRIGKWFLAQPQPRQIKTELEGFLEIPISTGLVILTAKADRIDILDSGKAHILDYKTGGVPTVKSVTQGYSPQLSLEGLILREGGFLPLPPLEVEQLSYWKMTGGTPAGEIQPLSKPQDLIEAAGQGVRQLFEAFFGRETPFYACPNPDVIPAYHDYAHLERLQEWSQ